MHNVDGKAITINAEPSKRIGKNALAGPLPSFASITVEGRPFFWIRGNDNGSKPPPKPPGTGGTQGVGRIERATSGPRQSSGKVEKLPGVTPRGEGGIGGNVPSTQHDQARREKIQAFERGFNAAESENKKPKKLLPTGKIHQSNKTINLYLVDVILAIASVWAAFPDRTQQYAFTDELALAPVIDSDGTKLSRSAHGIVGKGKPLLIPIYLDPPESAGRSPIPGKSGPVGGIGHLVLVLAQPPKSGEKEASFMRYDSRDRITDRILIFNGVQKFLKDYEWCAGMADPTPQQFTGARCPAQTGNTCGLHSILAAWALMLNIELVHDTKERRPNFYEKTRDLVNLALAGAVDLGTIQAYFEAFRLGRPTGAVLPVDATTKTKPMNEGELGNALALQAVVSEDETDNGPHGGSNTQGPSDNQGPQPGPATSGQKRLRPDGGEEEDDGGRSSKKRKSPEGNEVAQATARNLG